jgi:hypothetical protein
MEKDKREEEIINNIKPSKEKAEAMKKFFEEVAKRKIREQQEKMKD